MSRTLFLVLAFAAVAGFHTDAHSQGTVDITVENHDPTGQWLYSMGTVQVQGIVSSGGMKASPYTITAPLPNGIRVLGVLGTTATSKYATAPTDYFYVNDRDSIAVNALTLQVSITPNTRPAGKALIQIVYPVVKMTVVSVDQAGAPVPGQVQVQGGTTSDGLKASPVTVTMVDSVGQGVRVRGVLGARDTGYTGYFVVTDRDLVKVQGGVPTTTHGHELSRTARIEVGLAVSVPVLASVGNQTMPEGQVRTLSVSATDADGTIPKLSAQNLPAFATFQDNLDGTGTLALSPSFVQSGVYENVVITARDAVDPLLKTSETITVTVTDASPLTVTVENVDTTGQWLYSYGQVQVQGAVTTSGFVASPRTVSFATGKQIRVQGEIGRAVTSLYRMTAFTEYFTVNDGDRVTVNAVTRAVQITPGAELQGTARVRIAYPVVRMVFDAVGLGGAVLPGKVQVQGGVTSEGLKSMPLALTMVDGVGKTVNVRAVLGTRDLGYVNNIPVTGGDLVTVLGGVYSTQSGEEPVNTARVRIKFPVYAPVLATVGNQTLPEGQTLVVPVSATDTDGTIPALSAANLPAFAHFVDHGNGTGTLTLSPSFVQAGIYGDVVISATDAVDPVVKSTETITITVTEAEPLTVTVENVDPTGQWLYEAGLVQVQGFVTTDGPKSSPQTLSFATGNNIRVLGQLGLGDEGSSFYATTFSEYFTVDDGDLFVIDALTMAIDERAGHAPPGEARVQIEYPVIKITVETVDAAGNQIPGEVQLQDGVTTKGLRPSPLEVTMVDAAGKVLNVRAKLGDRDLGYVIGVPVTNRDLVTIEGGVPGTQENLEPVNTARISVGFAVSTPVLAQVGDQTLPEGQIVALPVSATDGDGTSPNLTAVNLPPFAALADSGDGTGVLTLSPNFEQAGTYPGVVIVATDEVDPNLVSTDTITITVTDALPLAVTVENYDPTGQWLYEYGFVQVQGAVTTNGPTASPAAVAFASGGEIRVLGQLGPGDEDFSFYDTVFSGFFAVNSGDRIVLDALTMAVSRFPDEVTAGTALVQISYPVIKITVETVDGAGNLIPGEIQLQDGVTTKGLRPSPLEATMVDGAGKLLDVRGLLGDRDLGFVADIPVTDRDLVTIEGGVAGTDTDAEPANTARIRIGFAVAGPVLAEVGNLTVSEGQVTTVLLSATDGDGTFPNLSAVNLPTFAALIDNGDGTGVLTLSPSFEEAGVYPGAVIVATDEVDPDLKGTETITITVVDAEPLAVRVENVDPTGQWLYDYGVVQVQGAATTNGPKASPQTVTFATGNDIRVLGQLGPGDEEDSFHATPFSEFFTADDGDLILIDALTMSIDERPGEAPAGEAHVKILYPVIKITIETVDGDGNQIPGEVQLRDGVTTKDLKTAPVVVTMVDGADKVLDVRAILDGRDTGFIDDVPITNRELVTIQGDQPISQLGVEPEHTGRISVKANRSPVAVGVVLNVVDGLMKAAGPLTEVTLDGSASSDPDGDELTYEWFLLGDPEPIPIGTGPVVALQDDLGLPLGSYAARLVVSDGQAAPVSVDIPFEIVDTTAPEILKISSLKEGEPEVVLWTETAQQDLVIECSGQAGEEIRLVVSSLDAVDDAPLYAWEIKSPDATGYVTIPGSSQVFEYTLPSLGAYVVRVTATDDSGNSSEARRAHVLVQDTAPPVLVLLGDNPMNLELGTAFTDPGATAVDACAGDLTAAIDIAGTVDPDNEGTYAVTYTVSDGQTDPVTVTRVVNVIVSANSYVFLATNSIWIQNKSQVASGFVGTNAHGEKPWLSSKYELRVGEGASTAPGVRLSAPDVRVDNKADIQGTLYYETLKKSKKASIASDVEVGPGFWPLVESLPPFVSGEPGSEDVKVKSKRSVSLDAGAYGDIKVDGKATLTLTGGTYAIASFDAKSKSRVHVAAPCTLLVQSEFKTGSETYFGPADGAQIDASDILVYVAGIDPKYGSTGQGRHQDDDDDDDDGKNSKGSKSKKNDDDEDDDDDDGDDGDGSGVKRIETPVRIGSKSTFRANVYAPSGTARLEQRSRSTGSFIARDIRLENYATVSLKSGWRMDGVIYSPTSTPQPFAAKLAAASPEADGPEPEAYAFGMDQNYPNPFNPSTTIRYAMPEASDVRLVVYNILGQEVRVLVNQYLPAGAHAIQWDGRDAIGRGVASGIYVYRLAAGDRVAVKKMIFAK
jgi:hypothetical protein